MEKVAMDVLVVGGCGFLGTHIVDSLLLQKQRVRILDRRSEYLRPDLSSVQYFIGDFENSSLLYEALAGVDVVIHSASATVPSTANLDPINDVSSNLISMLRFLDILKKSSAQKVIYMSSGGTVYGVTGQEAVDEGHARNPISSYGIVKSAIEDYLLGFSRSYGKNVIILRVSNPYGPRQGHAGVQGIIGTYLQSIILKKQIEVWGDGSTIRDYLYAEDFASLCASAVVTNVSGVFNAGSGQGVSVLEIIERIGLITGVKLMPTFSPSRSFDIPRIVLNIDKADAVLGWRPTRDLNEGLQLTWNWVQKNF